MTEKQRLKQNEEALKQTEELENELKEELRSKFSNNFEKRNLFYELRAKLLEEEFPNGVPAKKREGKFIIKIDNTKIQRIDAYLNNIFDNSKLYEKTINYIQSDNTMQKISKQRKKDTDYYFKNLKAFIEGELTDPKVINDMDKVLKRLLVDKIKVERDRLLNHMYPVVEEKIIEKEIIQEKIDFLIDNNCKDADFIMIKKEIKNRFDKGEKIESVIWEIINHNNYEFVKYYFKLIYGTLSNKLSETQKTKIAQQKLFIRIKARYYYKPKKSSKKK